MRNRDDQKEETIRQKAIEMIVNEGFDGLSMQKLAKAAGISASTIYIYFKSREDLLNQIFLAVAQQFEQDTLRDFDPAMNFEQGLWQQWLNRYEGIRKNPFHYAFFEQFMHSPLIRHEEVADRNFRDTMDQFVQHAIERKEIIPLPPDLFWTIAYGPLYTLVKIGLDKSTVTDQPFSIEESKLRQVFKLVIKALKP